MDSSIHLEVTRTGERLDRFVADQIPQMSRSSLKKLIDQALVTVNGSPAKPSHTLQEGDHIDVQVPHRESGSLLPQAIELSVIYEDADLAVIDKPPGMVVHPSHGHEDGTVVNALLARYPQLAAQTHDIRPGVVHRLDKDTSGLLIVALHAESQRVLQQQFKERLIRKTYLALVDGELTPARGLIDAPIGRDVGDRKRMAVVRVGGKEAQTEYEVIDHLADRSLLEVRPRTGRTHQIRVHLSSIGHPVAGDSVYGRRGSRRRGFPRQFLHAWRISFVLPSSGAKARFEAPLPEDLRSVLNRLGGAPALDQRSTTLD